MNYEITEKDNTSTLKKYHLIYCSGCSMTFET